MIAITVWEGARDINALDETVVHKVIVDDMIGDDEPVTLIEKVACDEFEMSGDFDDDGELVSLTDTRDDIDKDGELESVTDVTIDLEYPGDDELVIDAFEEPSELLVEKGDFDLEIVASVDTDIRVVGDIFAVILWKEVSLSDSVASYDGSDDTVTFKVLVDCWDNDWDGVIVIFLIDGDVLLDKVIKGDTDCVLRLDSREELETDRDSDGESDNDGDALCDVLELAEKVAWDTVPSDDIEIEFWSESVPENEELDEYEWVAFINVDDASEDGFWLVVGFFDRTALFVGAFVEDEKAVWVALYLLERVPARERIVVTDTTELYELIDCMVYEYVVTELGDSIDPIVCENDAAGLGDSIISIVFE